MWREREREREEKREGERGENMERIYAFICRGEK